MGIGVYVFISFLSIIYDNPLWYIIPVSIICGILSYFSEKIEVEIKNDKKNN